MHVHTDTHTHSRSRDCLYSSTFLSPRGDFKRVWGLSDFGGMHMCASGDSVWLVGKKWIVAISDRRGKTWSKILFLPWEVALLVTVLIVFSRWVGKWCFWPRVMGKCGTWGNSQVYMGRNAVAGAVKPRPCNPTPAAPAPHISTTHNFMTNSPFGIKLSKFNLCSPGVSFLWEIYAKSA